MDPNRTSKGGVVSIFLYYWRNYGGFKALLTSCYFWAAVLVSIVMFGAWKNTSWSDWSIGILPSMMGFSLGSYAVLLAFGNDKFLKIAAVAKTERCSAYEGLNATFTHFIVVQVAGLLYALVIKSESLKWARSYVYSWLNSVCLEWVGSYVARVVNGVGIFLMVYAIFLGLAATMALLRFSKLYNQYLNIQAAIDAASGEK